MDYQDINHCIEILQKKPTWFFQQDTIAEKLQCFDTIQKAGTSGIIYSLVQFLKADNVLIQYKAAETILVLFAKLKSLNDYEDALKYLPVENSDLDYYRDIFDEKTYGQLVAIASLNKNGYLREKAIGELARLKNEDGLKFILLRLGDWVEPVRKAATEAVSLFLEARYTDTLLKQLSTIDWLLKVRRVDLTKVHDDIIQFLFSQELSEEFYNKIRRLDDKTRFRFYKIFLDKKHPSKEQIAKIAADKSFLVRLELIKHLPGFDTASQKDFIKSFLQDHTASVRLSALYASKHYTPLFDARINQLLSDEATPVRELSRHLLKSNVIDFSAIYRQRIASLQLVPGSILGLSETGNSSDLPLFEQYLHSGKSKVILACLSAIHKFNAEKAKQFSLALLVHPGKKVRDKAVEILAKNCNAETLEEIRKIYSRSDYQIKKSILKFFNKIGGWNCVGDLLLALADENKDIQTIAWQLLDKWKSKATRLFTTPPAKEIERAKKILAVLNPEKLNMTDSRSKLLDIVKFILR